MLFHFHPLKFSCSSKCFILQELAVISAFWMGFNLGEKKILWSAVSRSVVDVKMDTSGRISKYRERLDKTLASPDLTNPESLKSLIKSHLLSTALHGVDGLALKLPCHFLDKLSGLASSFCEMKAKWYLCLLCHLDFFFLFCLKNVVKVYWRDGPQKSQIFSACWEVLLSELMAQKLLKNHIPSGKYAYLILSKTNVLHATISFLLSQNLCSMIGIFLSLMICFLSGACFIRTD